MNTRIVAWIAIMFIFVQIAGCKNVQSPDEIAKAKLLKATKLLISRDKVAAKPTKIFRIKENIAAVSTTEVDNFVKERINLWIDAANELEKFSHDYPLNKFSKDTIFAATLLWIGISQADQQYSQKTVELCKNALSINYNPNLNDETIKMLKKAPSMKYLIENELHNGDAIHSFLRGTLITEYIKINDVASAENWLKATDIPVEEKQRLNKYIHSHTFLENKLAE